MGRALALVSLLFASCVSSQSNVCSDGSFCPAGFTCDVDNHRCILPSQTAACEGKADGEDCMYDLVDGACLDGACEALSCGDTRVSPGEGEECDVGRTPDDPATWDLGGQSCGSLGFYVNVGEDPGLGCTPSCSFDLTECRALYEYCGDDEVNGPELCDGPEVRTCVSIGFDAGTTTCVPKQCTFSLGDCSRFGWNPESLSDVIALDVAGSERNDQWAVGVNGKAMHFEGAFWNTVPTNVQNTLISAWSNADNDTWAVGQSRASGPTLPSVVIHWDGNAWSTVTGIPSGEYVDVWGDSPTATYVATTSGAAIHKWNGSSWSMLPAFTGEPIAIRGSSETDIYVATKGGPLMYFNGTGWTDRSPPNTFVKFLDVNAPDDVWAIGHVSTNQGTGVIAHWNGSAWQQWVTAQEIYNAIASSAPNDTWVAGVDGIMRHYDGVGWSRTMNIGASPSGLAALSGLLSFGPGDVVGVSTQNLAYRYRGQAFGLLAGLGSNPFDATTNRAMWAHNTNTVYVTNVDGEVWLFNGTAWSLAYTVPSGTATDALSIWGTSPSNVWVGAQDGTAHHYNGSQWAAETVAMDIPLWHTWFNATSSVWMFGSGVAFQRVGTTWTPRAFGTRRTLSVSGTADNDIWIVEAGATSTSPTRLLHWNGVMWAEVLTGSQYSPLAVIALAPDNVHVTATEGRLLHFTNNTWTESTLAVLADLRFLTATASDDVIAASERELAHFNGTAWSTMRTPIDFVPNTADYLPIIGLHASPGRIDFLQEKYRIRTLIRTRPLACRQNETCGDAVDNDCDGKVDTVDKPEC